MKKVSLLFASIFLASTFLISCSSDDSPADQGGGDGDPTGGGDPTTEENIEDREIPISELQSKITIENGTFIAGKEAPAPNGTLDFQLGITEQEGLLNSGFDIVFSSTSATVKGAYVVLKDVNGNNVDGYFDAGFSNNSGGKTATIKKGRKATVNGKMAEENELTVNVNFDASLQPGKFCYAICIYDEAGNISQIQEVCVNIEAWGGNTDIVGEWIYNRSEGTVIVTPDNTTDISCENGQSITNVSTYIEERDTWTLTLSEDGIYVEVYDELGQRLDYLQSEKDCEAVYFEDVDLDKYSGNWAYNEQAKTLTTIDFMYEDLLDATNNETYPDGSVYFEGAKVEIVNAELRITETFDDNGDGITETETYIFKRK